MHVSVSLGREEEAPGLEADRPEESADEVVNGLPPGEEKAKGACVATVR